MSVLLPAAAAAQTVAEAAGAILGVVQDGTGAVLPHVTVTLSSSALMATRQTLTSEEGRYRFAALPPGEYQLSFALQGFKAFESEAIRIALGFTATIDVVLVVANLPERVRVTAPRALLDRHSAALTVTFDAAQLANLPGSRSMFALLSSTPAVEVGNTEVGGGTGSAVRPYSAYGTRGVNRPMLEGINISGIFPTGFTLDYGSFEEVSVLTGAHGAEWPTPGVHMQFSAKSGGNQYRGTLYADYEDRRWQSFNVDQGQISRGAAGGHGFEPRDANRLWRYRDVNADAGGFIIKDRLWWYGSIREQEVSARLLNFPVRPHRTGLNNISGKATLQMTTNNKLIAFGQAGWNHQPNRLDPFGPVGGSLGPTTAFNESDASTINQRALGWVWKAEWNSVVGERLLFELRGGQFGSDQDWTPNSALPRFEDIGTSNVRGGNRDWQRALRRNQAFGLLSYFTESGIGSHHVKAGVEISRGLETETWRSGYPGDVLHVLRNTSPIEVYRFQTPSTSESGLWSYTLHASDSLRIADRLTLTLGARFDRYRVFLPAQAAPASIPDALPFAAIDNVIDWNVIVPRVGAVYDLTGDGSTLLKASAGRYRLSPGSAFGFTVNPNSNEWWTRYAWTDTDGSGAWNPGEEGAQPLGSRGGIALESLDPDLKLPIVNEFAAWLERSLPAAVAVRTGLVWRREHQHFARQNASQPRDAFTVAVTLRDPGPDGLLGTGDDGPALDAYDLRPEFLERRPAHIVRNVEGSSSQYWTWEISAARRLQGRWSLGAGFAHTWNRDHAAAYGGQALRNNTYPVTPNDAINAEANGQYVFTTWTAKAQATYQTRWNVLITPAIRHQSGQPFGRTFSTTALSYGIVRVLAEPVGTRRLDNITIVDVRTEKRIPRGGQRHAAAFVDVFNLFNANPEQNVVWSSGPSFLRPVTIVPPRIVRVGMKFAW